MQHLYSSYGLIFASDIELPELADAAPTDQSADVILRRAKVSIPQDKRAQASWYAFTDEGATFWWSTVGGFRISTLGDMVDIEPAPGVNDDLIAFPLLGPVLSEVLRRQGYFVMHASAVEIDGRGVALMADKGTGKSSSCMALLRGGARILADDLVAVETDTSVIQPGFAQVKLDQRVVNGLNKDKWIARPTVHDAIDKVRVMVPDLLAPCAVPAARLYVLERRQRADVQIDSIPTDLLLPSTLRFSYAARFGATLLQGEASAGHFRHAAAIVNKVLIKRLILPDGLDRLDALYDVIASDLRDTGDG